MASTMLGACLLGASGCVSDVPHENAYDPLSANPIVGTGLSGTIVLKNYPAQHVAGAVVTLLPAMMSAITDTNGTFSFGHVPDGVTALAVQKTLCAPETVRVSLARDETRTLTIELNSLPSVTNTRVVMRKIDQWWPNPIYSASVSASADDANGVNDLDSLWVTVDTLRFEMTYSVTDRNFQAVITPASLPSNSLEWLIGKPIMVHARDKGGAIGMSPATYAARIIENEAQPVYPALQDTVVASPEFSWSPPGSEFPFTYSLTVVRLDAGTQTVVWTRAGLGSYLRAFQYPASLQPGLYFWTIAIVDEFGNMAQSKESTFVVK
ncbi:MAG TPA: carboxypeptidase regulatory-like domain-containing protein [Bacteroidota bacterium]|nr:carboxypeptidase regulatory-like domain-containing protein [Bacteroidota bacterium]